MSGAASRFQVWVEGEVVNPVGVEGEGPPERPAELVTVVEEVLGKVTAMLASETINEGPRRVVPTASDN